MLLNAFTVDDCSRPNCTIIYHSVTVNYKGVLKELIGPDARKGVGPDGLSAGLLQVLTSNCLTQIFEFSLSSAQVPHDWRHANVVLIYKKSARANFLNLYGPVSLTSVVSKVLEHIISHNINLYLDSNGLLTDIQQKRQHGCDTSYYPLSHIQLNLLTKT